MDTMGFISCYNASISFCHIWAITTTISSVPVGLQNEVLISTQEVPQENTIPSELSSTVVSLASEEDNTMTTPAISSEVFVDTSVSEMKDS